MKIEFNASEFDPISNRSYEDIYSDGVEAGKKLFGEYGSLMLGVVSFILAISNLLFGLFMNFSTEILGKISDGGTEHWISVLIVAMSILIAISVICGFFFGRFVCEIR